MNDNNNLEQVEQLIERLEKDFKDLKLAVRKIKEDTTTATRTARAPNQRTTQELEIGCKAKITNNIRPFQEREGKVVKLNRETDRVTVQGRRRKGKVIRALRNVTRIERYTGE